MGAANARAQEQDFLSALKNYKETFQESAPPDQHLQASDSLLEKWSQLDGVNKARWAEKVALVHFRKAQIYANRDNCGLAAQELIEEIKIQSIFGGRIEHSTKTSDAFFEELVELQALVTAETGSDPLAGQVGYYFAKNGNGFTAARLELGDDIAGITVPEIGADEALALVYRLNRQGGKFVATASRWLVVPKGQLPDVLKQATREVAFESSGKMMVHRLKMQGDSSPKANPSAATNTTSPQVPALVQPSAPKRVIEAKPSSVTPSEKPTSSTPWAGVAVLIVAAIGLLWLLLKKRK
ncbi:MAG: hypothetical protein WCP45_12460 [Verrucomicrobiota bacterium]